METGTRERSIKYRLTLGYILSMCISIIIVIVLFLTVMKGYNNKKLYENDLSSTKLFYSYLENEINNVKLISNNIVISNLVQNRLKSGNNSKEYYKEINRIVSDYKAIRAIYIVTNDMKVDAFNDRAWYQTFEDEFKKDIDLDKLNNLRGKIKYDIKSNKYIGDNKNSIILSRAIVDDENFNNIGYLIIDISNDYLNSVYSEFIEDTTTKYILTDSNNSSILLSSDSKIVGIEDNLLVDNLLEVDNNDNGYSKLRYNYENYNTITRNAEILNGTITALIKPVSYFDEIKWIFIIVLIINVFFAVIYFKLIKKLVLQPIHEVTDSIENIIKKSDLDVKFNDNDENYEINKINIALNGMMDKINVLVDEVKSEHTKQRKFELDLLTNHVKPHFLFNVLNVARALIVVKKYEDSQRLLDSTAQYYRSWLNKGSDVITLKQELDILKYYIEIMKIRDAEEFTINYYVDEDALSMKIPKLILQPLVENTFKHAINDDYDILEIEIHIRKKEDGKVEISVRDNGNGIEEEVINKIYNGYDLRVESGFGMRSILERLCLYYGTSNPREIVKIKSSVGEYTNIIINLDENNLKSFS